MATRRTTRASSNRLSSRGATPVSVAPSSVATGTPRRSARRSNVPTAVNLRPSNAYGTNDVLRPGRSLGPRVTDTLENILGGILDPVVDDEETINVENDGVSDGARGETSSPRGSQAGSLSVVDESITFHHESGVFGNAGIESSVVTPDDELSDIDEGSESEELDPDPKTPRGNGKVDDAILQAFEEQGHGHLLGRDVINRSPGTPKNKNSWQANLPKGVSGKILMYLLPLLIGLIVLWSIVVSFPGNNYHHYGYSPSAMKHNIAQFLPTGSIFSPDHVNDFQRRMANVEREIFRLSQRPDIEQRTLDELRKKLPDVIVGKKDKSGKVLLPAGLWRAIQDQIRVDDTLLDQSLKKGKHSLDKKIGAIFDQFVHENEIKVKAATGDTIDQRFPALLESAFNDKVLLRQSEVVQMIQEKWKQQQSEVKTEMVALKKELQQVIRSISKLESSSSGNTKVELQAIAKEVFNRMLSNAQLQALSKAQMRSRLLSRLDSVNHFSRGTGAVIEPHHTSPTFIFPSSDVWFYERMLRAALFNRVPVPKSPVEAITKWEEHGDCWCSPSKGSNGFGPSLSVLMGSNIFPEEVIIEHIPKTASLEPGSAPQEMELLAFIPDPDDFRAVKAASNEMFRLQDAADKHQPASYVRIANWTYDVDSTENVQAFPVQVDLKTFKSPTNKLIVRSRSNYGAEYTCFYRVRVYGAVSPGAEGYLS